jgi:acetoin utilization deacetylase AcuC-like enzyme
MKNTAVLIESRYEGHLTPSGHPERTERIAALVELMSAYRRDGLVRVEPRAATNDELLTNHGRALVYQVQSTAGLNSFAFDADTYASADTYQVALFAAGGLLAVLDAVMEGKAGNGFAMVRPPGHHAEADRAMGFCFFNNVAIGARYLQQRYGLGKVLVVDFDVHHGNGTQRSFYAADDVMYISTHQYPFYPGTGAANEIGVASGMGFTVNVPFPAGFGDDEYLDTFARVVEAIARQFAPDFV